MHYLLQHKYLDLMKKIMFCMADHIVYIIGERASSVMFVFNRDFRYVRIFIYCVLTRPKYARFHRKCIELRKY